MSEIIADIEAETTEARWTPTCVYRDRQGAVYSAYPTILDSEANAPIVESKFSVDGKTVLFLENVISEDECRKIIAYSDSLGFDSLRDVYSEDYRNNDRIMVDDPDFTAILQTRLRPYLDAFIDAEGTVAAREMSGLNHRLRVCKYNAGGVFQTHRDGATRLENPKRVSYYTIMAYLNTVGPGDGGRTRFYSYPGVDIAGTVSPKAGSVVIFDHRIQHDGELFTGHAKYILRSDTLFPLDENIMF
jgi:hypothetical protein